MCTALRILASAAMVSALTSCCHDESIPKNIRALYSAKASERNEAALALSRCGSKAEKAVLPLSQALYDSNVGVQSSAAYALRKIDTPSARRALEEAIERRDRSKRR